LLLAASISGRIEIRIGGVESDPGDGGAGVLLALPLPPRRAFAPAPALPGAAAVAAIAGVRGLELIVIPGGRAPARAGFVGRDDFDGRPVVRAVARAATRAVADDLDEGAAGRLAFLAGEGLFTIFLATEPLSPFRLDARLAFEPLGRRLRKLPEACRVPQEYPKKQA
jgi:hypothetical protein